MTFNSRVFCIIPRASAGAVRGETTCTQSCQLSQSTEIKGCVWDLGPAQPWLAGASIPFVYPIPLKAENGDRQFQWLCGEEKGPRVGSRGGALPPFQQSANKVLFSLHLGLGKGGIKDVMPLAISRFPAALSKLPVPGPHVTHTRPRSVVRLRLVSDTERWHDLLAGARRCGRATLPGQPTCKVGCELVSNQSGPTMLR